MADSPEVAAAQSRGLTHAPITLTQTTGAAPGALATGGHVTEGNTKLVPWLMLCAILSGFAVAFSVMGVLFTGFQNGQLGLQINRLEHDNNVLKIVVQDQDSLLIREGFKLPGDITFGPSGNLTYTPHTTPETGKGK